MDRFKGALVAIVGAEVQSNGKVAQAVDDMVGDIIVFLRYPEERVKKNIPEKFLCGRRVYCEGTPGKSKGKGTPVTHKKWAPAPAAAAPTAAAPAAA
jgi:hypothetical protein